MIRTLALAARRRLGLLGGLCLVGTALPLAAQTDPPSWIQDRSGAPQPTFYLDDLLLVAGVTPSAPVSAVTVDVLRNRHPISEMIYGLAFASSSQLADLNSPLNRSGGNPETRYNWELNAHNRAVDYYFESIGDGSAVAGADADSFVGSTKAAGAEPMLTVSLIGWAAKLGPNRAKLASYSIAKYGAQTGRDAASFPDAGNGISAANQALITWNDPNDANVPVDSAFQQNWIRHLISRWGLSNRGGVRYYHMDNEPSIWHSTHRDVHPTGAAMQEVRDRFFEYAAKVKAVDPAAVVLGPEEWGWSGYLYSGLDLEWANSRNDYDPAHFPDRANHGGWDYLPWLLDQARQRATATGQRLLDVFTVHYYPQGGEFGDDTSSAMQLRRNQSTRSLWDPAYVDASWINSVVKLIPRVRAWANTYYPGTKIGLTEYNWGAEGHINGATAQADVLGILGREGVDYGVRWTTPATGTPAYQAIKLFRNYDGQRSGFGDISVSAVGPNPDQVAAFAALRSSSGAMTLVLINKQLTGPTPVLVTLTNFLPAGLAQVWQLSGGTSLHRLSDLTFSGKVLSNSLPAQSITLLVLPPASPPRLRPGTVNTGPAFDFWLEGRLGERYVIQSSRDLATWLPLRTNLLDASPLHFTVPATSSSRFYRAQWVP